MGLFAKCFSLLIWKSTQFGNPLKTLRVFFNLEPHLWGYSMEMLQDFLEQGWGMAGGLISDPPAQPPEPHLACAHAPLLFCI